MDRSRRIRGGSLVTTVVVGAMVLSGCGGGGSSSDDSRGGSAKSGIDVSQAESDLEAVVGGSGEIVLPSVGASIPTGKTIDYLTCQVEVCAQVGEGVKQAADVLGWKVRIVQNDGTPAGYKTAWKQISQNPADGVINASPILPYPAVSAEMDTANVPVVGSTSPNPVGGHLIAVVSGTEVVKTEGAVEANWVIQDAGEPVKSVYVYDPSIPALASAWPGYQEAMKKNCSACSAEVLKVSAAQIGPALAQQVVSYLQANPDVKYVAFGLGSLGIGVPAAIKAAGLQDQVKLTTRAATSVNFADVKAGGMSTVFTDELYEAGWRAVDKLARSFAGAPIGDLYPEGTIHQVTADNLPTNIEVPYTVPDYQAAFVKAWGTTS